MKKLFIILLLLCIAAAAIPAGDLLDKLKEDSAFYVEEADLHDDLLFGMAPLYLRGGIDYTGLTFIKDQRTDIYLIAGGSLISSELWTDQQGIPYEASGVDNTTSIFQDYNAYNKIQYDLSLKLKQGLINSPGRENAFLAVYGRYDFHWTYPQENLFAGAAYSNFLEGDISAYPDKAGTMTNVLKAGVEIEGLDITDVYKGYNIDCSVLWAPEWFFNTVRGSSNFYNINLTAKGYYPLLELERQKAGLTMIGIYLADRISADYSGGAAIPQYYQENTSLGTKMRGFEDNSMGTAFTIVNNFEVRFYGPELFDNINPLINLFFDAGFFTGKYYNTEYLETGEFRFSAGFEAAVNFVDFLQVGLRAGFPIAGTNLQEKIMLPRLMLTYKF